MNLDQVKAQLRQRSEANLALLPSDFIDRHRGEPALTVVMLSHGRLDCTLLAIRALKEHTRIPVKLLLIDNGSDGEVQSALHRVADEHDFIRLICLSENLGCAGGRAFALSHVSTEFLMFIDNDIEVLPGAVEHLLFQMESHPDFSAVAGNAILPSGLVHLCGGDYKALNGLLTFDLLGWKTRFDDQSIGRSGPCRWVNGGFTLMRREFLARHPYDLAMEGYYEDLEWCYRLNRLGLGRFYRVVEAAGLHYHEPKHAVLVSDQESLEPSYEPSTIKCVEAIAHFYKVHGQIIQNLFDFVPELGRESNKSHLASSRIILDLVNAYGGEWLTQRLRQGRQLLPLVQPQADRQLPEPFNSFPAPKQSGPVDPLIDLLIAHVIQQCELAGELTGELTTSVAERQRAVESLSRQINEQQDKIATLVAQAGERQRVSLALQQSKAYKLAGYLWKVSRLSKRVVRGASSLLRRLSGSRGSASSVDLLQKGSREGAAFGSENLTSESSDSSWLRPSMGRYDVIFFPVIDWEFRFQRPQQIATQYARAGHRVFYLRTRFHEDGSGAQYQEIGENIYGVQLSGSVDLNLYQQTLSGQLLESALACLEEFRQQAEIETAVCLIQLPFWGPIADEARRRWGWKVIYDCMDDHSGFSTNTLEMLQLEDDLVRTSDLVIASAKILHQKAERLGARTLLLPNATDYEHFSRPSGKPRLEHLSGPIIGYYGAISEWFDVDMIRFAASARPNWNFVMIGSTFGALVGPLKKQPNVHLLGELPYADLPDYLARFDVACIPFLRIPLTEATNPVKFYEYLSAGKPIVSVELPELEPYRDYFYAARNHEEFILQVETALRERSAAAAAKRIDLARQHTWESRFRLLGTSVADLFPKAAIVIVSYNNLDYLRLCLESIWSKTAYPNFEVIVVDNHSEPEVVDYLNVCVNRESRLKVIFNGANLGFAAANNIGIREAGACEYLVLLNNDTVVTRGWLGRLTRYLDDPQIGLVGPVTNSIGNEARINTDYANLADLDRFAARYTSDHAGQSFDIGMLAMYCVGFRKRLSDQIGLLDERFAIGMFEDDDYSLRVREAGYRIVCAEDVFVHHWGGASFKKLDPAHYQQIFEENQRKFEAKWGRAWQAHRYRHGVTTS